MSSAPVIGVIPPMRPRGAQNHASVYAEAAGTAHLFKSGQVPPGQAVMIRTYEKSNSARTWAQSLKTGKIAAWSAHGQWEAAVRKDDTGRFGVWVRLVDSNVTQAISHG
jgi:hypothetical protein